MNVLTRIPIILLECPISTIRKHADHCLRYMQLYRLGVHGPLADYAMRRYTSHRKLYSFNDIESLKQEFEKYRHPESVS